MLQDNPKVQEFLLVLNSYLRPENKKQRYVVLGSLLALVSLFFILKFGFFFLLVNNYQPPEIIYQPIDPTPLEIVDQGIFNLGGDTYSGFVKLKNINLKRGVPKQGYTAQFRTTGGTVISRVTGEVFVLPAQEKVIVFSRFTAEQEPDELRFNLTESQFNYPPEFPPLSVSAERVRMETLNGDFAVSAVLRNSSPFIIREVRLPVVLYNSDNNIVGVNLTNINDVKSEEGRSFRVVWPIRVEGAVRAEVRPEINIFDRNLISTEAGQSGVDRPETENNRGF
jgi:hypothetical protein